MPKKILFLSGANLTVNPRLLKELKLAVKLGYEVDFVGFNSGNWSDKIDNKINKTIGAKFHYIPIIRKPFINWFLSTLYEKLAKKLYPFFNKNLKVNAYGHSKRSILLDKYLRTKKESYDIVIAHTLATLYPAYKFATRTHTKFSFDIEDYHPGEVISHEAYKETSRRLFLMQTILPKASYITYASPLIGEHSMKLIPNYPKDQHFLINNCFSSDEFQFTETTSKKVEFVWFSQNISEGRGLELVIPALEKHKEKLHLTLIGNLYTEFYDSFLKKYSDFISIAPPLPQIELNKQLSKFDIGLAVELNSTDINRQVCLTNKIWAYLQSGIYILATDTLAQQQFLSEHSNSGLVSEQKIDSFASSVEKIISEVVSIRLEKKIRFEQAKKLSWEQESKKLITYWQKTI